MIKKSRKKEKKKIIIIVNKELKIKNLFNYLKKKKNKKNIFIIGY